MLFNSVTFAVFFALVLVLHRLPLSWRIKKVNLLWLSYVFYGMWNPPFMALLAISTIIDWNVGKWLHAAQGRAARVALLLASLVTNLGMLCYFKYGTFALENFQWAMQQLGVDWQAPAVDIVLPVGISFYTFQTLSYTLDIYLRKMQPWHSLLDYSLYVAFFPQLVAGPIVRAREFLPQCEQETRVDARHFSWGLSMIVLGLFEKVVIADSFLAPTVERIFDTPLGTSLVDGWIGSAAFAGQVFCDFAGYSTIAIGVGKCLGFQLPQNFNFPLASVGFIEFWRRWHMSLSFWLRDYVYFAMGGSRVMIGRQVFNILLTWALIGLWHGAAWNFVLWGVVSGVYVVAERLVRMVAPASALWSKTWMQFVFACVQFVGFCVSLLVFRAPTFDRLFAVGGPMFGGSGALAKSATPTAELALVGAIVAGMFLVHWFMRETSLEALARRTPWWIRGVALGLMAVAIVLSPGGDRAFIYFQF